MHVEMCNDKCRESLHLECVGSQTNLGASPAQRAFYLLSHPIYSEHVFCFLSFVNVCFMSCGVLPACVSVWVGAGN